MDILNNMKTQLGIITNEKKNTEESEDHENIDYNVIIYSHVFPLYHIVKITW